ncbi:MAG: large conductance mechanosensitive channel protein MscL [Oscillospiraceae bacterium]|nr:large conductance mechanosensitive channel protein MscL [Oscillospiraceae bacterium]
MGKFMKEFREFVLRGNVLNLAVGVIIGAAFQSIVTSLTTNILSPILGLFTGNSFDALHVTVLGVDIQYGAFITSVINFLIMSFIVFLLVKFVNKIMSIHKKPEEPAAPTTRACPFCVTDISIKATRCPACTSELAS